MIVFKNRNQAFTIVELLVVIVVIGILAAMTIVSYSGIANRANIASVQTDLANASKKIKMYYSLYDTNPTMSAPDSDGSICPTSPADANYCIKPSAGTSFIYSLNPSAGVAYTLTAIRGSLSYQISDSSSPIVVNTPLSPTMTSLVPNGTSQMTLNWTAPAYDGGSAITGYKVYRGTSSGSLSLAYTLGNVLSYVDNSGISAGNTYYYKVQAINANGDGSSSNELNAAPVLVAATGGTVTTSGGYKIHTFTSSGTLNITTGGVVDVLIVGGGGAGGNGEFTGGQYKAPGGGGAGGVKLLTNVAVTPGESISVVVGDGGIPVSANAGGKGMDSSFKGNVAAGGGGGGGGLYINATAGGSGGGGGVGGSGAAGTSGQGYSGGTNSNGSYLGSGGGGAGGVGVSANSGIYEAPGGLAVTHLGYTVGKGGAGGYANGTGALSGGANTGNGGDGAKYSTLYGTSYAGYGGSGIVVVRYVSL